MLRTAGSTERLPLGRHDAASGAPPATRESIRAQRGVFECERRWPAQRRVRFDVPRRGLLRAMRSRGGPQIIIVFVAVVIRVGIIVVVILVAAVVVVIIISPIVVAISLIAIVVAVLLIIAISLIAIVVVVVVAVIIVVARAVNIIILVIATIIIIINIIMSSFLGVRLRFCMVLFTFRCGPVCFIRGPV